MGRDIRLYALVATNNLYIVSWQSKRMANGIDQKGDTAAGASSSYGKYSDDKEAKWRAKMKHFFGSTSMDCGNNHVDRFEAYEKSTSNEERLEILFHLPIVQVKY